jgi:hypothetical protein
LPPNVILVRVIDGRQFSWDVEVYSGTVFLAQAQVHELSFRGVVVKLTWWPHLQEER